MEEAGDNIVRYVKVKLQGGRKHHFGYEGTLEPSDQYWKGTYIEIVTGHL